MQRLIPASGLSALVLASALVATPALRPAGHRLQVDRRTGRPALQRPAAGGCRRQRPCPSAIAGPTRPPYRTGSRPTKPGKGAENLREDQQDDADAETEATQREKDLAERAATCKQAQERVTNYNQAQKLYKPGPNGDRIYLTDEELDAERADAQRVMEEWCSDE